MRYPRRMLTISEDRQGEIEVRGPAIITSQIIGDVTVAKDGELRLMGEVLGNIIVKPSGGLIVLGRVKGKIINEGGAVDIFGFVGQISDCGTTETFLSRGAILGGKRASRPSKLSSFIVD